VIELAAAAAKSPSAWDQPGTLAFLVIFGMAVILYFVFRSLGRHLRKINEAARLEAAQADAAQSGTGLADAVQADAVQSGPGLADAVRADAVQTDAVQANAGQSPAGRGSLGQRPPR
jgi:hypothetical protein